MRNRGAVTNNIISHLSVLKAEVELRSKVNLQDINVHAEQFYKILLNDIFGYNLENINIIEQNAAVIDLGDKTQRIAIQVTSNNTKRKILETVQAFKDKKLYEDYDELKILVIKDKIPRTEIIPAESLSFDMAKDVMDVNSLTMTIMGIDDLDRLEKIEKWLSDELVQKHYAARKKSKPNEAKTFIALIDFLSDENNHQTFVPEDEPDPEFKIETRFKEYAPFLKRLYSDLYIDYGYALSLVEENAETSAVKLRKIGLYLKDVSNKYLISSNNDPQAALDNLCEFFADFFVKENLEYDEMAIKFYLIHQLINCNVFPN